MSKSMMVRGLSPVYGSMSFAAVVVVAEMARDLKVIAVVLALMFAEIVADGVSRKRRRAKPMDMRNKLLDKFLASLAIGLLLLLDVLFINFAPEASTQAWWVEWTPFTVAGATWVGFMDFLAAYGHIERSRRGKSPLFPPGVTQTLGGIQRGFGVGEAIDDENYPLPGKPPRRRVTDRLKPDQIERVAKGQAHPRDVLKELDNTSEQG